MDGRFPQTKHSNSSLEINGYGYTNSGSPNPSPLPKCLWARIFHHPHQASHSLSHCTSLSLSLSNSLRLSMGAVFRYLHQASDSKSHCFFKFLSAPMNLMLSKYCLSLVFVCMFVQLMFPLSLNNAPFSKRSELLQYLVMAMHPFLLSQLSHLSFFSFFSLISYTC